MYEWINTPAQIIGRFNNNRMLWHNIMDFFIPTYWTLTSNQAELKTNKWGSKDIRYGTEINTSHHLIVWDDSDKSGLFYVRLLSDTPPIIVANIHSSTFCYKNIGIGLRKINEIDNKNTNFLLISYKIDPKGVKSFRDFVLHRINVTEKAIKKIPKKPRIIIIQRKATKGARQIINYLDVFKATIEMCPKCSVELLDLQKYNKYQQIEHVYNASLIIGAHGSGLTHLVWLKKSTKEHPTGIVEIMPFMYNCRQWFSELADLFGVQYFLIETLKKNQSRWNSTIYPNEKHVIFCHSEKHSCIRQDCHDFLRDQSMIVDINLYKKKLKPFIKDLTR